MPEWITHRLPTDRDADEAGDVWIPRRPRAKPSFFDDYSFQHFTLVVPGQPWYSAESA